MGLSPTKPTTNLSNRGGERGCDDTTIEPDIVATITNVTVNPLMSQLTQHNNQPIKIGAKTLGIPQVIDYLNSLLMKIKQLIN